MYGPINVVPLQFAFTLSHFLNRETVRVCQPRGINNVRVWAVLLLYPFTLFVISNSF